MNRRMAIKNLIGLAIGGSLIAATPLKRGVEGLVKVEFDHRTLKNNIFYHRIDKAEYTTTQNCIKNFAIDALEKYPTAYKIEVWFGNERCGLWEKRYLYTTSDGCETWDKQPENTCNCQRVWFNVLFDKKETYLDNSDPLISYIRFNSEAISYYRIPDNGELSQVVI